VKISFIGLFETGLKTVRTVRLYLDLCVYNRPFDDQSQIRIALETNAFVYLLDQIENAEYTVLNSEILRYENSRDPDAGRRERVDSYLRLSNEYAKIDEKVIRRAEYLRELEFGDLDALHLAVAEGAEADYFVTCDDGIVKKADTHKGKLKEKVKSLLKFVAEEM
jgi:hypothetical protein